MNKISQHNIAYVLFPCNNFKRQTAFENLRAAVMIFYFATRLCYFENFSELYVFILAVFVGVGILLALLNDVLQFKF